MPYDDYFNMLADISKQTQNDIILMTIVIIIGLVVFFIPFMTIYLKAKKETAKEVAADKRVLIDVIQKNTDAIVSLKVASEINTANTQSTLMNIERETDTALTAAATMLESQKNISTGIERILSQQLNNNSNQCMQNIIDLNKTTESMHNKLTNVTNGVENINTAVKDIGNTVDDINDDVNGLKKDVKTIKDSITKN